MVKKALINISFGVALAFSANFCLGLGMVVYTSGAKIRTTAYQEHKKVSSERWDLERFAKDHSQYLTEENKKALESKVEELKANEEELYKELKPYDDKAEEWLRRSQNPLEYFI